MPETISAIFISVALISVLTLGIYSLDNNRFTYVSLVHKYEGNYFKILLQSYRVNKQFQKYYLKSKAVYNIEVLGSIEYWCRDIISDPSKYKLKYEDNILTIKKIKSIESLTITFDILGVKVNNVEYCIIPPYYAFLITKVLKIQKNIKEPIVKNKFDK